MQIHVRKKTIHKHYNDDTAVSSLTDSELLSIHFFQKYDYKKDT